MSGRNRLSTCYLIITDFPRLILYYPVSSLVTIFANILQNPQDTRARSDLKLMTLVVNFLSTLCSDEENGSVRRMLSICSEFERIARVVLEKADKESSSKRKRRQQDDQNKDGQQQTAQNSQAQQQQRAGNRRSTSLTPSINGNAGPGFPHFTSNFTNPVSARRQLLAFFFPFFFFSKPITNCW